MVDACKKFLLFPVELCRLHAVITKEEHVGVICKDSAIEVSAEDAVVHCHLCRDDFLVCHLDVEFFLEGKLDVTTDSASINNAKTCTERNATAKDNLVATAFAEEIHCFVHKLSA